MACDPGHLLGPCKALIDNPPWILATSVAAAPAILMTWFWRTMQRNAELKQRGEELRLRDRAQRLREEEIELQREQFNQREAEFREQQKGAERTTAVALEHARIAQDTYLLDRYSRAVDGLTSPELQRRMAGISLVTQLARGSEEYVVTVCETLAAFVRERAARKGPDDASGKGPPIDVTTALRALGGITRPSLMLDISRIELGGVQLAGVDLSNISFSESALRDVDFSECKLRGTSFYKCDLAAVLFDRCDARGARFDEAKAGDIDMWKSSFNGAEFNRASITESRLMDDANTFEGATYTDDTTMKFEQPFDFQKQKMVREDY